MKRRGWVRALVWIRNCVEGPLQSLDLYVVRGITTLASINQPDYVEWKGEERTLEIIERIGEVFGREGNRPRWWTGQAMTCATVCSTP